jgi:hypothetical protein
MLLFVRLALALGPVGLPEEAGEPYPADSEREDFEQQLGEEQPGDVPELPDVPPARPDSDGPTPPPEEVVGPETEDDPAIEVVGPEVEEDQTTQIVGREVDDDVELEIVGPQVETDPGGDTSGEGATQFPEVVALGGAGSWHCTGTLVAPGIVLTARHCLPVVRVHVGGDVRDPAGTVLPVVRSVPHPERDVALVELAARVGIPTPAWRLAGSNEPLSGVLKLVGFGSSETRGRDGAGVRRIGTLAAEGWGCDASRARTTGCVPGAELVLATPEGTDTCDGDSGGPAYFEAGAGWLLVGVTSRPIRSARSRCGDGGVYTRLDVVSDWIFRTFEAEGWALPERRPVEE